MAQSSTCFSLYWKSTTDQWKEESPMYWTMRVGVGVFLISLFQRIKLDVTVLHPNECKRVVFHLARESGHQVTTVVAAHCGSLLRILLLWWRLEMLAPHSLYRLLSGALAYCSGQRPVLLSHVCCYSVATQSPLWWLHAPLFVSVVSTTRG